MASDAVDFLPAAERPWFVAMTCTRLLDGPRARASLLTFLPRGTQLQLLRPSVWSSPDLVPGAWMGFVLVAWTPAAAEEQLEGMTGWVVLFNGNTDLARLVTSTVPMARPKSAFPVPPHLARVTELSRSRLVRLPSTSGVALYGREEPDWSPRSERGDDAFQ